MTEVKDIHIQLVKRCKKGDAKAQYTLYKSYVDAMYNTAMRLMKNQMDAEDIIQESFIQAFSKISSFRGESSFGAWLKRIVVNNCLSELRKNKIYFEDTENIPETGTDHEIEETVDPEWVNNAIKALPDGARTIFTLHAMEGFKHKEIAKMLKISESTSKTQYLRAKLLLPGLIKEFADNSLAI